MQYSTPSIIYLAFIGNRNSGENDDNYAVVVADAVGGYIGSYIGKRFGGSKKQWYNWGAAITSAIVEAVTGYQVYVDQNSSIQLKKDFSIISSRYDFSLSDSIGYYHYYMMVKITQNMESYLKNGTVDKDLIYDDIVTYSKELGIYAPEFNDADLKSELITHIDTICDLSVQYAQGFMSKEVFVDKQVSRLKAPYGISNEELNTFKEFIAEEADYCVTLDEDTLHEYAQSLDTAIDRSGMSLEMKGDISLTSQIIINSTLCWNQ